MNKFFLISTVLALIPLCCWGEISPSPGSSGSPTVSQRRGRLLLPSGTPTPSVSPAATPIPTPVKQPTAIEEPTLIPAPSAPPGSGSQKPPKRGQFKSQAQKFNPRKVVPMPSGSPSPESSAKSKGGWTGKGFKVPNESSSPASSPAATSTPAGKLTKQEKKEQKSEERKELKREQREGSENASPSATP